MESVKGLAAANERMKEIAVETAGAYFVFSVANRTVVAIVDATYAAREQRAPKKNSGVA